MQLAVQTMTSYPDSLALAEWAEGAGLAGFAVADHYLPGGTSTYALDQPTLLGAVAARTQRIQLSTLVSPITFRHPAVMLKTAVTIDQVSQGRFTLGIGAGWMAEEHDKFGFPFPPIGERFDLLTEALGYIRAGIEGDTGFDGRHFRLAPGTGPEPRGQNLRMVVGGKGTRRTPVLAGTFADEYNAFPSTDHYSERIKRVRQAAADAGRDPATLLMSTAFPLVVGADRREADARLRQVADRRGGEPDDIRRQYRELGLPLGTVDEFGTRLAEIEAEGVQRVYFQVAFDDLDDIVHAVSLLLAER